LNKYKISSKYKFKPINVIMTQLKKQKTECIKDVFWFGWDILQEYEWQIGVKRNIMWNLLSILLWCQIASIYLYPVA